MTRWRLILESLCHYWRANFGVGLGAMVATAVLVGSLVVGDSVRQSLRELALLRLGGIHYALSTPGRYFRDDLADGISAELGAPAAPVLAVEGTAAPPDGSFRVNSIQVLGVDGRFWRLAAPPSAVRSLAPGEALVNEQLAYRISSEGNGTLVLRVEKPSALSREAALSTVDDSRVALRVRVSGAVSDEEFGRFSLRAGQIPPGSIFVPLAWLQRELGIPGRAGMVLLGNTPEENISIGEADAALRKSFRSEDAALEVLRLPARDIVEVRSERVFIDPPVADAVGSVLGDPARIFTYFVNGIVHGGSVTPYSMVTGLTPGAPGLVPDSMADDEALVNQWLADDLGLTAGDAVELRYLALGPDRSLEDRARSFRVRDILPMEGSAVDPDLTPEFPGLSGVDNCRDWEPGFPIDLEQIRPKDEAYWDKYRGTPKVFVALHAAREMWGNRFGDLTAFRFPAAGAAEGEIERKIADAIDPASIGLFFRPVRRQALAAANEGMDFGQLFLGFSVFLIIASLLLTALLFVFGVEQRAEEAGTLLAVGFPSGRVRRLFLSEGVILAAMGGVLGTALGILYTRTILRGLATVWSEAGGGTRITFHMEPQTLVIGFLAGLAVSSVAIWLAVRKQAKAPVRFLLQPGSESGISILAPFAGRSLIPLGIGLIAGVAAAATVLFALQRTGEKNVGLFFGAGALFLVSTLGLARYAMFRFAGSSGGDLPSLAALGVRNTERRSGRSLATVALLAVGSFLVVAVGANRHDPFEHKEERSSGTGGFALYGGSALPVFHDLNTRDGLDAYGLTASDVPGVHVVSLRVRDGDDASCLNLNRAQVPRILGVSPSALADRRAFTFTGSIYNAGDGDPWILLNEVFSDNAVPVIGDEPTLVWGLGKSVGDTIVTTDGRGETLALRVVGIISSSILQGSLLISDVNFVDRFPGESGYRAFLIDAPQANTETVSRTLSRALRDAGVDLIPAGRRLAEFNRVENTYLSIFQVLGGLGMILGSIGLGVVVLRNVLERRRELALLRAVGFDKSRIRWLILSEHWFLLAMGLAAGVLSGFLAVLPALSSPGADIPHGSLALTLAALLLSGLFWTWLAASVALRGDLLPALRDE